MYAYVSGDVEVHEKLSSLNYGKHAYIDMAMNVFSLAVIFPIFCCVLQSSCLELWLAKRAKDVGGCLCACERMRKRGCQKREIYRKPSHVTSPKGNIYFWVGQFSLGFNARK